MRDIAIVGMACMFPGADGLGAYWRNIVAKVDAVGEPPLDWYAGLGAAGGARAHDAIYCKRGGYLGDLARFKPSEYGVMPTSIDGGDPDQFLALRIAHEALADAGYRDRPFNRERTEVILGRGAYINRGNTNMLQHGLVVEQTVQVLAKLHPELSREALDALRRELEASLPPCNPDMAAGLVPNVVSGRIANRLDLMGPSYTVDAACASALVALEIGMRDLVTGRCDMALVGGVHVATPPPVHLVFCQLNALSKKNEIRPFHRDADGTMLGEGLGVVVLKRREDAERDGDRIYAVVKGVGTASDGRALGLLAPRLEGEILAMRRAYEASGVAPDTVGLVEAHGTGTPVGDATEIEALRTVLDRAEHAPACAIGSVKSMIGHTLPAAGMAGLIKTALSLYHKVLPPTLHCEEPNPALSAPGSPIYANTETRPWIHGAASAPRRAGVNAFGFGGINAHAVLEEHPAADALEAVSLHDRWDSEALVVWAESREDLAARAMGLAGYLQRHADVELKDLAHTLNVALAPPADRPVARLALVAATPSEARQKLEHAAKRLADPTCRRIRDKSGIYYFAEPLGERGTVAFLFPGEGSQYVNMLGDLCLHFPEVRECFDLIDRAFLDHPRGYLPSQVIFPPAGGAGERERLWQMDVGAESVFIASQALLRLLSHLEIRPHLAVGHSTGEYSALLASGAIDVEREAQLIEHIRDLNGVYGRLAAEGRIPEAVLLAVGAADPQVVAAAVAESGGAIQVAMDNCPHQIVLCGDAASATVAAERIRAAGGVCQALPFGRAYHTPAFEPVSGAMRDFFDRLRFTTPQIELYSCVTAAPYPRDGRRVRDLAFAQWARPVRFRETILAMHDAGARVFIEVGPRNNLTSFVDDTLRGRPYLAVPANVPSRSGIAQLNHLVALLAAHGVPFSPDHLYARRRAVRLALDEGDRSAPPKSAGFVRLTTGLPSLAVRGPLPSSAGQAAMSGLRAGSAAEASTSASGRGANGAAAGSPASAPTPGPAAPATSGARASAAAPAVPPATPGGAPPRPAARPVPRPAAAAQPPGDARGGVMREYLKTMDAFLATQEHVMRGFLARRAPGAAAAPPPGDPRVVAAVAVPVAASTATAALPAHVEPGDLPLLGAVESIVSGESLAMVREVSVEDDAFLEDHTLGGPASAFDRALSGLPVMPLTMSMEMMAEAAAALSPGGVVTGLREVRGHRFMALDRGRLAVRITARLVSAGEVRVEIRDAGHGAVGSPIVEGLVTLGARYPEAPAAGPWSLADARPSTWRDDELYARGMFHGPRLRGVRSVVRWGRDGTEATLAALPSDRLFRDRRAPRFLIDPVTLDAAGQLVGYWTGEHLEMGFNVFPYRVGRLEVYGPALAAPETAACRARIRHLGPAQLTSDIDVIDGDGRVRLRLLEWEDRRFDLPEGLYRLRISPLDARVATEWPAPLAAMPDAGDLACWRVEGYSDELFASGAAIWRRVLAHLVLSRAEREAWAALDRPERLRNQWLLGRVALKDAVRSFVKARHGLDLYPADVEIAADEHGAPRAQGPWLPLVGRAPAVSLAHVDGVAVALAGDPARHPRVGVDVERIGRVRADFADLAFSDEERRLLDAGAPGEPAERALRAWCAKEAVAKALGRGLMGDPRSLALRAVDATTGLVRLAPTGALLGALPEWQGRTILAHTWREGDIVAAVSVGQPGEA